MLLLHIYALSNHWYFCSPSGNPSMLRFPHLPACNLVFHEVPWSTERSGALEIFLFILTRPFFLGERGRQRERERDEGKGRPILLFFKERGGGGRRGHINILLNSSFGPPYVSSHFSLHPHP